MSQWNNSYSYNQYQGASAWNNDLNGQYSNQQYYSNRPEQTNQYVGFNEFLSQIQPSGSVPNTSTYNNAQYENYSSGQYRYQNVHSTPQNAQVDSFKYPTNQPNTSNAVDMYQVNAQNQYSAVDSNVYTNDMILKSNLHPTATEFVPKSYMAQPSISSHPATNSQNIPETSIVSNTKELSSNQIRNENINQYRSSHSNTNMKSRDNVPETRTNQGSSSDTNWRERPQNTKQNKENRSQDSYRNQDSTRRDISHWNELSSRDRDSHQYETKRHYDPNEYTYGQNDEASSSNSTRNYESNRFDNRNDKRGQKGNSKVKNKDTERMFYNSSIVKDSQDVRSGRGEPRESSGRNRNWGGSQRLRALERNNMEDEQYASSYFNNRDERSERVMKSESTHSPARNRNRQADQGNKEMTQRERLTEQLDKGTLECLVCCERVKQIDPVWSCSNCYHVLHLRCIRKWAMSSIVNSNWRCPACQNTNADIPTEYRCMCGAVRSPEYQRGSTGAHTCGKSCKRPRQCPHPCMLLCHPGPCPPCQATVNKQCGCGAETRSVLCSSKLPQVCGRVCNRTLECGVHKCKKECHEGPCDACTEIVTQVCHCPAAKCREVECTIETGSCASWSCSGTCGRVLACGAHVCRDECHPPPCNPCKLLPETVITCPCGKTKLDKEKRKSCMDPIPLCGNICAKPLECGPAGDRHFCKIDCHQGPCPVCPDKTVLQCRCGHSSRDVPCADLPEMYNNVFCQKKCNKKLSCGRHRCRTACCACASHRCALTCGRTLSCQTHRCEEFCHTGHCAPCPIVSFEELTCECGAEVLLPPVRCGTKPPPCTAPCRRERPCGHPPHHSCHSGDCPPCVVLTTKRCHGGHEERKTIPCSQEEFSCGLPCGKPLPCGKHTCIKTCHKGPCDTSKCTQPCNEKRPSCGHPCAAPCHFGNAEASVCPSTTPCRRLVRATCPCKRRQAERPCCENARDYAKMMSALAATKMQEGGSVDLSDVQRPGSMLKTLECDDECRVEARTRQLALALQIRNPDVSAKLAPRYSEHVRTTAAKEPAFAQQTHDKLTELVHLAKKSKQKTRSHSFPSMNWQKRQFIHELCEHFGCESVAYDAEPNRNVVATADKEKSWLPAMSILEVLSREAGKRRVPGPVLRASTSSTPLSSSSATSSSTSTATKSASGWATLTSTNAWAARSQAKQQQAEKKIDYFDNPPEN
ncbi:hypothetical protein K1T71_007050 [Dendrolimus kikuchii]|uniref:Uncharacterized protein n=1 Tax=Dendrolimus kikuchii TaxID=765133 RepID=A0ACC1CZL7_9NEOP|nr:hypothetical protein K1T71_007050 [Dendrolimus kikuchii]